MALTRKEFEKLLNDTKGMDQAAFLAYFQSEFPNEGAAEAQRALGFHGINKSNSSSSRGTEKITDLGGFAWKMIDVQTSSKTGVPNEFMQTVDLINLVYDTNAKKFRDLDGIFTTFLNDGFNQAVTYLQNQKELLESINVETSLTGKLSEEFRDEITQSSIYAARLGLSMGDVARGMSELIKQSGRFKLINEETINKISLTSKVFFDSVEDAVGSLENFQKVSRGAEDAMVAVEKAGRASLGLGLNAKTTTKTLVANLEKLNQFGFKNGIEGLTKMIQKAQALRLDLNAAFTLADKVMDPTNALSMAANLSVIGGALGDFNDPIKMMWMATNNVEGLQDALAESAESLVTFNQNSGVFEIVGADLRRAKAMADELGMGIGELQNLAVQSAQRTSASIDLMSRGLKMSEEDREFITNIAQMKGGKMVVEMKDPTGEKRQIALETLNQTELDLLLARREDLEDKTMEDIVEGQATAIENMNRNIAYIATAMRVQFGKIIEKRIPELLNYDPSKIITETRKLGDEGRGMVNGFTTTVDGWLKEMIEVKDVINDSNKKSTSQNTSTNQSNNQTITYNVNHNFSGSVPFDSIRREMESNPEFRKHIERSFLNISDTGR